MSMSDVNVVNEEQSSSSNSFVIRMVANVLGKLIDRNTNVQGQENSLLLKFQSSYIPEVAVEQYLDRIRSYSRCSDACFIMSLVYLDKLIEKQCLVLTSLNVHRLMITCVMLSAKFHDDLFYSNAYFSKLGGVSLRELNMLESDMLNMLSFSLFVDVESYFRYFIQLQKYFLHLNMDFERTVSPAPQAEDFGRIIIHPPPLRPPSTPSPCLIPHNNNNNFLFPGHHHHQYSNNNNNNNNQSFPFTPTMYATDPSGSTTTTKKKTSNSSSSSLLSSSWMTEHEEMMIPWSELSHEEISSLDVGNDSSLFADTTSCSSNDGGKSLNNSLYLCGSSSSFHGGYDDGRLFPNPPLGLPLYRDDDDGDDDACRLPSMPYVNDQQRDMSMLSTHTHPHAIHSAVPQALHSGFGFYQQQPPPPPHHQPPPPPHHQPPPPHHHHHHPPPPHHHHQLSYQMPGFYPDNTIHRDWPIQYHSPSSDYTAVAAAADDDHPSMMTTMMMGRRTGMTTYTTAPTEFDPTYHCCSYLDSDYPAAAASGGGAGAYIPSALSSHYPHMILYVAPPMVWSNIY